jgi:glycosyltransferase involved in cell wall biosynthesis
MTRVLSVIHSPFFGGPHNQVLRLAGPLEARGFSTLAVVPDEPGNAFQRLERGGVEVIRMPLGRLRARPDWRTQRESARAIVGDVSRLSALIRREGIDLVVVHGSVNLQSAYAARRCSRPAVVQVLDTRTPFALRLLLAFPLRLLATTVMTTGDLVADVHPWLPRDPGRLFPFFPPVDTGLFKPDAERRDAARSDLGLPADHLVVGCVANLTPQKDLVTFVDVADRLAAMRPSVSFVLLGRRMATHEDYAERVLRRARSLIDAGRLIVRDVGDEVARYLNSLDVFLATAGPRSEGISTTILEAMSAGIPVVSTDVGGIREAVAHGRTGFVVPASDTPALVDHVERLLAESAERSAMARASRERALRDFDVEDCADVHARAFSAALAQAAR